uniref:Uncharacterized protein n=1 Tax=Romanomermis culicivorax TaxID=13658 RepID=A0A915LBH8_ROMCU
TELTFYAINQETGFICHRDQFSTLFDSETIDQVRGELDAYFRVESLSPSTSATNANKKSHFSPSSSGGRSSVEFPGSSWGAAEIGFIALAGLIGVGSLVALIFGLRLVGVLSPVVTSDREFFPLKRHKLSIN